MCGERLKTPGVLERWESWCWDGGGQEALLEAKRAGLCANRAHGGAATAKFCREAHARPGAVRIKNPRRDPLNRGERRGSPVNSRGWDPGAGGKAARGRCSRPYTSRGSVHTTARRGAATALKIAARPITRFGSREEKSDPSGIGNEERRQAPGWQREWGPGAGVEGGQGALSSLDGQGLYPA